MEVVLSELRSTNSVNPRSPATTAAMVLSTCSSSLESTGTTYVAPMVFGQMPIPLSGYEHYGDGYQNPNPIQSSPVHVGSTNLHEQHVDEVPQSYCLHNLNSQRVFLADGTERRYYALPEDYPLERATPKPVFDVYDDYADGCSNEFVPVFASTPEQQSYEEDKSCLNCMDEQLATPFHKTANNALSEQLLTCFSKAPETEESSACLNMVTDVLDVTLEREQLDGEKASSCPVLKAPDSFVTSSNHLNIEHNILELRLLWDPGEHTFRSSTQNRDSVGVLQTSLLTEETTNHLTECSTLKYFLQSAEIRYPRILSCFFVLRYSNVKHITWLNTVLQSVGDHVECMNPLSLTTPWDPGVLVLHCGITCSNTRITRAAIWSKFSSPTSCELPQSSSVKWRTFHMLSNYLNAIFSLRMMQNAKQCLRYCYREVTEDCLADQELMKNTSCRVAALTWHSSVTGTPFLLLNNTNFTWDPGALKIKDTMLSKTTVPNLMDLKHFWAQLLLHYEFWCTTLNAFLQVQESCLPIVLDCLYTETVQQLVCYSRMFSSTEAILSAVCMPTITTVHMIQLVDYSAIHACYMVYALLPPTQIAAYGSSNITVDEITSRCLDLHLNQINIWTRTTSNGITSSEYAYTIDFIPDQWEYIHQQGVHENYNAKLMLLSSHECVKIREIGIIFMTFRPP